MENSQALAVNGKSVKYNKNCVDDVFSRLDFLANEILAE